MRRTPRTRCLSTFRAALALSASIAAFACDPARPADGPTVSTPSAAAIASSSASAAGPDGAPTFCAAFRSYLDASASGFDAFKGEEEPLPLDGFQMSKVNTLIPGARSGYVMRGPNGRPTAELSFYDRTYRGTALEGERVYGDLLAKINACRPAAWNAMEEDAATHFGAHKLIAGTVFEAGGGLRVRVSWDGKRGESEHVDLAFEVRK